MCPPSLIPAVNKLGRCRSSSGSEEIKQAYLPRLAAGEAFAYGLSEREAGSDTAGMTCQARDNGDGTFTPNGGKAWITNAGVAGSIRSWR